PHHAAVEKPEPRDCHHQHESHGGQHPGCVSARGRTISEDGWNRGNGSKFVRFGNRGDRPGPSRGRGRSRLRGSGGGWSSGRRGSSGRRRSGGRIILRYGGGRG